MRVSARRPPLVRAFRCHRRQFRAPASLPDSVRCEEGGDAGAICRNLGVSRSAGRDPFVACAKKNDQRAHHQRLDAGDRCSALRCSATMRGNRLSKLLTRLLGGQLQRKTGLRRHADVTCTPWIEQCAIRRPGAAGSAGDRRLRWRRLRRCVVIARRWVVERRLCKMPALWRGWD